VFRKWLRRIPLPLRPEDRRAVCIRACISPTKNFDLKQYFKEGRGCRTEGTFRNPHDFGINKGQINRRLLEVERVSHNSGVTEDGKKSPGLKFGQPRVMALFLALTLFHHLIAGAFGTTICANTWSTCWV
jgi:hypothetical protein